jgi:hypothetical protein
LGLRGAGDAVVDDSNWIRIVFAIAEAIEGDGGCIFYSFSPSSSNIFCSVIDVSALRL